MQQQMQAFETYLKQRFELLSGPKVLKQAMEYSLFSAGKRLRPYTCLSIGMMKKETKLERLFPLAMAIEMVHTYSLIHDDLPAMDDDDLRRGKPSNHKVYGEAVAILAGDALLSQSFEVLAETKINPEKLAELFKYFSRCIGTNGMVGGQVLDINLEVTALAECTLEQLQTVHEKKTGKLLELCLVGSAYIMNYPKSTRDLLIELAQIIGILYQAMDDLLDVEGGVGKTQGIDQINGKITYFSFYDKTKLNTYIAELNQTSQEIIGKLAAFGYNIVPLMELLQLILRK